MSIIYGNMVGGASGTDGKSAYAYAVEGGYTGTETEFAEKMAEEQLTGTTNELTPTQVYDAVSSGIPVKVQYTDPIFGISSFTAFNVSESMNVIASNAILNYQNKYLLAALYGDKSSNGWLYEVTPLAKPSDIPSALPNPNALTFTGAVTGSYDGSEAVTVEIPSGGGGDNPLRLIKTVTLAETVKSITVDTDNDGNAFSLSEIYITTNATNSEDQTERTSVSISTNGKALAVIGTLAPMSIECGKTGESGRNWIWLISLNPLRVLHGEWITSSIASGKNVKCFQANEFNDTNPNPYSVGEKITSIEIYGTISKSYLAAGSQFRIYGR